MPSYIDAVEANKFFDPATPESDIFPLPVVAFALGVGRNLMSKIPVQPIMIKGRKFYRKGAILDWALTGGGMNLLHELRARNTSIGRAGRNRSAAYVHYYTGDNGPDERKQKDLHIKRLWGELEMLDRELYWAPWPESEETAEIRELAVETYNTLVRLRKRKPNRYAHSWWLIADDSRRSKAHRDIFETPL